jgi:hypothetical protein
VSAALARSRMAPWGASRSRRCHGVNWVNGHRRLDKESRNCLRSLRAPVAQVDKRADGVYDLAAFPAWLKIKNPDYSQARDLTNFSIARKDRIHQLGG